MTIQKSRCKNECAEKFVRACVIKLEGGYDVKIEMLTVEIVMR